MNATRTRREALSQECARQRDRLGLYVEGLRPAARFIAPAWSLGRFVQRRPALAALLSMALLRWLRRRRWVRYAGGLALVLRAGLSLRRLLRRR